MSSQPRPHSNIAADSQQTLLCEALRHCDRLCRQGAAPLVTCQQAARSAGPIQSLDDSRS
eukprot:3069011-Rhodomonas_salina.2